MTGTSRPRHRFTPYGAGGKLCTYRWSGSLSQCSLGQFNGWHYTDQDHPFEGSDDSCEWVLQTGEFAGGVCSARGSSAEHKQWDGVVDPTARVDETIVMEMQTPVAETAKWSLGHVSPPDEDSVVGGLDSANFTWSANTETIAALMGVQGAAARAAQALRDGDVVVAGPWPVRQLHWAAGDMMVAASELIEALAIMGEPFTMTAWWLPGGEYQMVRVVWSEFMVLSEDDLLARVASWSG